MTRPQDERPQLDRQGERFVERLAAHYTPTPMTPAERVAFDTALWARLSRRSRRRALVPAVVAGAAVAAITWLTITSWVPLWPQPGGEPEVAVVETPRATPWESELLFPHEALEISEDDNSIMLPDDYRAIARVFLDD